MGIVRPTFHRQPSGHVPAVRTILSRLLCAAQFECWDCHTHVYNLGSGVLAFKDVFPTLLWRPNG